MSLEIKRIPTPDLGKKLKSGDLYGSNITMVIQGEGTGEETRGRYLDFADFQRKHHLYWSWNTKVAQAFFGKPDCYFLGEWRYGVYLMVARKGRRAQTFLLWADPLKAKKGTAIEPIEPFDVKLIHEIVQWFHTNHPAYQKEVS